jgi:hypothetical protein
MKPLQPMPDARLRNNITYEYRNVAVDPDTPSIAARMTRDRRTTDAEET